MTDDNSSKTVSSYSALQPKVLDQTLVDQIHAPEPQQRPRGFVSLRWKFTLPLLFVVAILVMLATYVISDSTARGIRDAQVNQLLAAAKATSERAAVFGITQRRESDRVAFTANVPSLTLAGNGPALQALLQPLAVAGDQDYLIIGNQSGKEIVGLQRDSSGVVTASQGALLDKLGFIQPVLSGTQPGASGIIRTGNGYALFTASPIAGRGEIVGVAVVGIRLERLLETLRGSSLSQMSVYSTDGELLRTTFNTDETTLQSLVIDSNIRETALSVDNRVPLRSLQLGDTPYQVAYMPLVIDSTLLGIAGVIQPNSMWYATDASRQWLNLFLSMIAGSVVLLAYLAVSVSLRRLSRITSTAQALAAGDPYARTNMIVSDEIGELGYALDQYATRVKKRHDWLEQALRNQRRETAQLTAVLASIPDGIIVQDLDGRVVMMNDSALQLIGSQRVFRNSPLNELTAAVTDTLGAALAPGVYSLGDPQRVPMDGKVLHAQAAAVLSMMKKRIGTVIVLRDVTQEVRMEQARESALVKLATQAEASIPDSALKGQADDALQTFIKEVNRNAIALQRMISEIRELSVMDASALKNAGQQALSAEQLLWNAAQEWQSTAQAAKVELHVVVLRRKQLVLGEERRLRWAIGNLIDNAVKYTPVDGHVTMTLKASDDEQYAQISISDTGYGISPDDLPNVFTRFYRGKPMLPGGTPLPTPGTGQGLFIAKRVIEAHGGSISLTSEQGNGTEVTFTLPLTANVTMDLRQATQPQKVTEIVKVQRDQ